MKRFYLLPLLAMACVAHAGERQWTTYRKLVESMRLDQYYSMPLAERDKLDVYLTLQPSNKFIRIEDWNLTVVHAGTRTALPLDPKGHLRMGPNPEWLVANASIVTNQPQSERINVRHNLDAIIPEGTQWQYNNLMGSVAQGNAVIARVAGPFHMFWPSMKSVTLSFDKPAQLTIQSRNGIKQYQSDAKNKIRLPADKALLKENPLMLVSARPLQAELDTE